jgi:lipoprotein-anchoring transpeptidase ErfK/SrfK
MIKAPNVPAPTIAALVTLAWPSSMRTVEPEMRALGVAAQPPAPSVQQAGAPRPASVTLAMAAPADASAVVRSTQPAAIPSAPAKVTTADGRTVLGTRSTIRYEPLYAVPFPPLFVRPSAPPVADSIVVYKRERTLRLFYHGVPVKSYFIALGTKPVGDKERAGDQRTPEGLFSVDAHNPASKYHLALHISYPDATHRARAASLGLDPGGDIMIHGLPDKYSSIGKDHRQDDWTNGCVALTNQEIEEIWHAVPDGTPVQIKP